MLVRYYASDYEIAETLIQLYGLPVYIGVHTPYKHIQFHPNQLLRARDLQAQPTYNTPDPLDHHNQLSSTRLHRHRTSDRVPAASVSVALLRAFLLALVCARIPLPYVYVVLGLFAFAVQFCVSARRHKHGTFPVHYERVQPCIPQSFVFFLLAYSVFPLLLYSSLGFEAAVRRNVFEWTAAYRKLADKRDI